MTSRVRATKPVEAVDLVDHPSHYAGADGGVECIDAIRSALGKEQFIGFLRGQVVRYQWRVGRKDDSRVDAEKAAWYANKLVEVLSE